MKVAFRTIRLSAPAAVLGVVLTLGAGHASAAHVACGDTITGDTRLDRGLADCPSNGIVIGADDVTLNLKGHRIDGDGTEFADCPEDENCDAGILIDGHDGVVIKNGSVRDFAAGALILRARDTRVRELSSSRNDLFGAFVVESPRTVVRDSSMSHNIAPDGDGIGLFGSDHSRILDSSIRDNPGPGIHVGDSAAALIKGNRLADNGPSMLIEADGGEVRRNRVGGGGGILVASGDGNVVARNSVHHAAESIAIENGSDNVVARNEVFDPLRRSGIRLGIGAPPIGGGHNVVRRNVVRGSDEDGFRVYEKDGQSVLRRNVAVGAKDDGFEVEGGKTKLAGNRATRNGDLGIDASTSVIDGGGNTARHNGDRRQCTNIAC